jgi:hypothetical protein
MHMPCHAGKNVRFPAQFASPLQLAEDGPAGRGRRQAGETLPHARLEIFQPA